MARVVYTGVNGQSEVKGSLFEDKKFWFSQKIPQRKWFIEQVEVSTGKLTLRPQMGYATLTWAFCHRVTEVLSFRWRSEQTLSLLITHERISLQIRKAVSNST